MIETILVLLDLIGIERVYLIVWSDLQDRTPCGSLQIWCRLYHPYLCKITIGLPVLLKLSGSCVFVENQIGFRE